MRDVAALQSGIRIVAATPEELVTALLRRRKEVRAIAAERRLPHTQGNLIDVIDGIWSQSTVSIIRRLGSIGLQMNAIWTQLPPNWKCPCCYQSKDKLIFTHNKVAIAQLVEHHDHFGSYVNHRFNHKIGSSWSEFPSALEVRRRLAAAVIAFDPTVICEPCNFAEGQAKVVLRRDLGLDKSFLDYFSFSPHEIRKFIRTTPNSHHTILRETVISIFNEGRKREIMAFRKDNVDLQTELLREGTHWRSSESSAPDADAIVDACEDILLEFGMETGGNFSLRDLSATDQGQKSDPSAWITADFKRSGIILKLQGEVFLAENPAVKEVGLAWRCSCCARSPHTIIRYNNSRKLTFQTRTVRPNGQDKAVCIDCHIAMINVSRAADVDRDDVTFQDIREIFAFGSNQSHKVRSADTAHLTIERVRNRVASSRAIQNSVEDEARTKLTAERTPEAHLNPRSVSARIERNGLY